MIMCVKLSALIETINTEKLIYSNLIGSDIIGTDITIQVGECNTKSLSYYLITQRKLVALIIYYSLSFNIFDANCGSKNSKKFDRVYPN